MKVLLSLNFAALGHNLVLNSLLSDPHDIENHCKMMVHISAWILPV